MKDMSFFRFLISKIFLKNLLYAVIVITVIIFGTFYILKIYTGHGQTLSVPDLTGMTVEEADSIIKERKFRYKINDSVYVSSAEKGTVVEQDPPPDAKVKEQRCIFLTMNALFPERVRMPKLTGMTFREARANMETYGLKLGTLKYVPDIAVNRILKQLCNNREILPNTLIEKGSTIDLVLGEGISDKKTPVPILLGKTLEQALDEVSEAYLNIGLTIFDSVLVKTEEDSGRSRVYKQVPMYGKKAKIRLGSYIDIWLTTDTNRVPYVDTTFMYNSDNEDNETE